MGADIIAGCHPPENAIGSIRSKIIKSGTNK
jgi:hypothetical protein